MASQFYLVEACSWRECKAKCSCKPFQDVIWPQIWRGDPINVYQYLSEGSKGGARPFSMMPRGKMRQQAQAEIRKFHLKIRRNIFTVKMVKYCNRLSREAVASTSLEILKTRS